MKTPPTSSTASNMICEKRTRQGTLGDWDNFPTEVLCDNLKQFHLEEDSDMEGYLDGLISGSAANDSRLKISCMTHHITIRDVHSDLWHSSDYVKHMCMLIE